MNKGQGSLNIKKLKNSKPPLYQKANIMLLKAGNFLHNARKDRVVIEAISIHEVNFLIENWQNSCLLLQNEKKLNQKIKEKLPHQYWKFIEVFSKAASDWLPLHKNKVDHNIVLKEENNLTSSLLYSMSLKQLELVKAYLKNHLKKGFIVLSDASYTLSVLFAKKPEGGWHFCVNYWKLNVITKKDRYPLPLIEKTLVQLSKAKIFIKLDVRQAFYWIQMKESVKDLTTF